MGGAGLYDTELMRRIITSQAARDILDELAPIYGEARVALWLFQVIGAELDDTRQWTQETMDQVVPHTATWSLDYWEDELALPRDSTMSTQQRRERILSYLRTRAPMNPHNLARVASGAAGGLPCTIEERTGAPSSFTLFVTGFPAKGIDTAIRRAVDRSKQARLSYTVQYEENTRGTVRTAGILQLSYALTITQDGIEQLAISSAYHGGALQMGYAITITEE